MNKRILTLLLFSLFFAVPLPQVARATYTLPPANDTQGYVNNLIQSYNALVQSNYAKRPDFSTFKANFSLYYDIGNTFNAVVMASEPSISGFVVLTFFPIEGDAPKVTLDTNHTFAGLTGIACACENATLASLTFLNYNNTNRYINLALGMRSIDITSNGMANSLAMADYLYRFDSSRLTFPPSSNPNQTHGPTLGDLIVQYVGYILLGIVFIFGSVLAFVEFVVEPKKRERFNRKFRNIRHSLQRDKEEKNAKGKQNKQKR